VYHEPPSCGTIRFDFAPPPPPTRGGPEGGPARPGRSLLLHEPDMLIKPPDDGEPTTTEDDDDEEEDVVEFPAFPLDVPPDFDATKDRLEIVFPDGRTVDFVRDFEYDAMHPRRHPDDVHVDLHGGGRGRARRLRRPRHRRMRDLCESSVLEDGLAVPECAQLDFNEGQLGAAGFNRVDYLPSNEYFDPLDPTQRFEYFEGRSTPRRG